MVRVPAAKEGVMPVVTDTGVTDPTPSKVVPEPAPDETVHIPNPIIEFVVPPEVGNVIAAVFDAEFPTIVQPPDVRATATRA
jgi:hypothetical protein